VSRVPGFDERVVILDRDGTLVVDRGYLGNPEGLEFESGAVEGLRRFASRGLRLVVITNQSGIGRGYFPLDRMLSMNSRLYEMVDGVGASLAGIYFCPHAPESRCGCRKPSLGLMTQAALELGFDPARAVVIGDKRSDVEFGRRAGATTVLIAPHGVPQDAPTDADFVARDLDEAARSVLSRMQSSS
jgi:D-glycero-D-manno-heptose 1,7-bisphosphate phosphatase